MRTVLLVAAIGVGSLVIGGTAAVARRVAFQETRELLPQPPAWVPFRATLSVDSPDAEQVVGLFYRASNGSTRLETGPPNSDVRVISIKNVPAKTEYVRKPDGSWQGRPMSPQSAEFAPTPFHTRMKQLVKYPKRVSVRLGEPYSLDAEAGFSAYQFTTDNGGLMILVPELNFFPIVRNRVDGRHEVYRDVLVGEPDSRLFMPPAGASIASASASPASPDLKRMER